MRFAGYFCSLLVSQFAGAASCPPHKISEPANVIITSKEVLIVTHASSNFDGRYGAKPGADRAIQYAKSRGIQTVYLQQEKIGEAFYVENCEPDYWVYSESGNLKFDVPASHVYSVGGHWDNGMCQSQTVADLLDIWGKQPPRPLTLTTFMDGTYMEGRQFEPTDSYYGDLAGFRTILFYELPSTMASQKMTLLEAMGVIKNETKKMEFLERNLPHFERSLSRDFRVELKVNDRIKLLQEGRGTKPLLRLEFLSSSQ